MKTIQTFVLLILLFAARTHSQDVLASEQEKSTIEKENPVGPLEVIVNSIEAIDGGDDISSSKPSPSLVADAPAPESLNSDPIPPNAETETLQANKESASPTDDQPSQVDELHFSNKDETSIPVEVAEVPDNLSSSTPSPSSEADSPAPENAESQKSNPIPSNNAEAETSQTNKESSSAIVEHDQPSEVVELNPLNKEESGVPVEVAEVPVDILDKEGPVAPLEGVTDSTPIELPESDAAAESDSTISSSNSQTDEISEDISSVPIKAEGLIPSEASIPSEGSISSAGSEVAILAGDLEAEETEVEVTAGEPTSNAATEEIILLETSATSEPANNAEETQPIGDVHPIEPTSNVLALDENSVPESTDASPALPESETTGDVLEVSSLAPNPCVAVGDYTDPSNCRTYISCSGNASNLLPQINQCPDSSAFHPSLQRCTRDLAPCDEEEPKCLILGSMSILGDNSSYYWCVPSLLGGYHKYHIKCSTNETFNALFGRCLSDSPQFGLINRYPSDRDIVRAEFKLVKKEIKLKAKEEKIRKKMEAKAKAAADKLAAKEQRKQLKLAVSEEDDDEDDD